LRVGKKTSAFLLTLNRRLLLAATIYPAMFEITGGIPEPIIDELKEAGSPEKMTGLGWKSDAAATVIHPLPKGTGDPPERHRRGKSLKTRIEVRSGFFAIR
jgi:hypothetical protein